MKLAKLFKWTVSNWRSITPTRVGNFIFAYWNIFLSWVANKFDYDWRQQQARWRATQVLSKSPQCLAKGECVVCGCDIPDKLFEANGCEKCYPKWYNEGEFIFLRDMGEIPYNVPPIQETIEKAKMAATTTFTTNTTSTTMTSTDNSVG